MSYSIMAHLIDGKQFAAKLREKMTGQIASMKADHNIVPGLAVVLVGEDPASQVYVRSKGKQAKECGITSIEHKLEDNTSEEFLLNLINDMNNDPAINGILVQLPLPKHIDSAKVLEAIDPTKDVDGFHPINVGMLSTGGEGMIPCTPLGSLMMLQDYHGDLTGMNAVVVGRSNIVGKPMFNLLLQQSCTVTVAHSRTKDIEAVVREADIVVAAVGVPELVKGSWIKPGATVIDVGINRIETPEGKTKLVGDVHFESAEKVAGAITPVPGGVGPMTIACLLYNTMVATCRHNKVELPAA
ncbi:MAG: bifunctional methylenetetrahydrofolate dehydrogenase/methenyltetrahydrofolate cyclohydrolase FolD [Gammaproteobacteria bacterium]|nr:bifunctional methylenetetrahydrofolate dehydrogenase/methenyltetrahydrofolate cyclohydrolase FolD [Gammaproteobacteria bacterium]